MKTLDRLRKQPHVFAVDDERDEGNGVIVMLHDGWEFDLDPGCGTRGFDTLTEAVKGCSSRAVTQRKATA